MIMIWYVLEAFPGCPQLLYYWIMSQHSNSNLDCDSRICKFSRGWVQSYPGKKWYNWQLGGVRIVMSKWAMTISLLNGSTWSEQRVATRWGWFAPNQTIYWVKWGGGSQFHLVQFSQLQVRTVRTRFPVFKSLWWWTTRHAVAEGFKRFRTASFEITKDHEASKGSLKGTI